MRAELRRRLGTAPENLLSTATLKEGRFKEATVAALSGFVDALRQRGNMELLLGFPSAPFILPLTAAEPQDFLEFADALPDHQVRISRRGQGSAAEWVLSPLNSQGAYELAFKLPVHVERWIGDVEGKERRRTLEVKKQFLSSITIYRMNGDGVRAYQLRYEASSLSQP
jgi:hypothetical protein